MVKYVSKVGISVSIAPDHKAIYFYLSLPVTIPRGPGFWKFNNTLLDDEVYIAHIRELIPQICEKYSFVQDKQLFWELLKMEIREKSISFAKQKSRALFKRETEISRRLDQLDNLIWFNNCNQSSFKPSNQEYLFGIFSNPANKELLKIFNYTLLFARYFIYKNKLHNNSLLITDFVSKITFKYRLENLD